LLDFFKPKNVGVSWGNKPASPHKRADISNFRGKCEKYPMILLLNCREQCPKDSMLISGKLLLFWTSLWEKYHTCIRRKWWLMSYAKSKLLTGK
jgi:hypothetical protein